MRSVLDVHWKDWCWIWNSNTLATWCEELTHWKRPSCWERLRAGGEGDDRGWDGWMASVTQWTWVWVNSGSWWWTGRPGVLRFLGLQSRTWLSDWTELNNKNLNYTELWDQKRELSWTVTIAEPNTKKKDSFPCKDVAHEKPHTYYSHSNFLFFSVKASSSFALGNLDLAPCGCRPKNCNFLLLPNKCIFSGKYLMDCCFMSTLKKCITYSQSYYTSLSLYGQDSYVQSF